MLKGASRYVSTVPLCSGSVPVLGIENLWQVVPTVGLPLFVSVGRMPAVRWCLPPWPLSCRSSLVWLPSRPSRELLWQTPYSVSSARHANRTEGNVVALLELTPGTQQCGVEIHDRYCGGGVHRPFLFSCPYGEGGALSIVVTWIAGPQTWNRRLRCVWETSFGGVIPSPLALTQLCPADGTVG